MRIFFNKYHGAGNDFIIIDNRVAAINPDNRSLFEMLCHRHFGIGADGLILLENIEGYDFGMRYFNSDGRESTMCGNGGRCIVAFAKKLGIIEKGARFLATDGEHSANIDNEIISLNMKDVEPPLLINGNHFINTGSPHYIVPVPDVSTFDVFDKGRKLRFSEQFAPKGTNVDFVEKRGNGIEVRTYERGVEAETLSCGTGVTAAAISTRWGEGTGKHKVDVSTRGGDLSVSFIIGKDLITSVWLTGPVRFVFNGEIEIG